MLQVNGKIMGFISGVYRKRNLTYRVAGMPSNACKLNKSRVEKDGDLCRDAALQEKETTHQLTARTT